MAVGDEALAAGMAIMSGSELANTLDTEMNKTRDYIAQRTNAVAPVAKGGTGATTASAARTNLGFPDLGSANTMPANAIAVSNGTQQLTTADPTLSGHAASKNYVDVRESVVRSDVQAALNTKVTGGGDVTFNQVYLPNSFAAVSGFTVAYINSDGRVSRGSSSERYKKYITDVDPLELGDIFPQLVRFQMRSLDGTGDGNWMLGYIAERLDENDDTERFVVRIDDQVESIDFIQMLIAQVANLNARLSALEAG